MNARSYLNGQKLLMWLHLLAKEGGILDLILSGHVPVNPPKGGVLLLLRKKEAIDIGDEVSCITLIIS